ncbi:MAG: GNAT family N-acetyltransferase [Neomegalonema sp.]|nr:GNAT family N-acetyltransferase [Neomegalonema sp.]
MEIDSGRFTIRLAQSEEDIRAAQSLRYRVFVEEMGAKPTPEDAAVKRESDRFDAFCKHLLLIDNEIEDRAHQVVGVYRLLHGSVAKGTPENPGPGFYTATEFDLTAIEDYPGEVMELGRSCVDAAYRGKSAMQLLWMGLSQYITVHEITLMFGTASFHGTDLEKLAQPLSYLYHNHLAPIEMRTRTRPEYYVSMEMLPPEQVNQLEATKAIPPLMKGYLRLGGYVGDGVFVDEQFNTVDVCVLMDTAKITARHKRFYARRAPEEIARILG